MSHLSDVRLNLRDLDALEEGAAECGFEMIRGKKTHNWYGRMVGDSAEGRRVAAERGTSNLGKCDHVLRLKGARESDYEIGVVEEKNGTLSLLWDEWGSGRKLVEAGGEKMAKIRREYAVAVSRRKAAATIGRKGYVMTRENLAGGRVRLRFRKR